MFWPTNTEETAVPGCAAASAGVYLPRKLAYKEAEATLAYKASTKSKLPAPVRHDGHALPSKQDVIAAPSRHPNYTTQVPQVREAVIFVLARNQSRPNRPSTYIPSYEALVPTVDVLCSALGVED